MTVYNSSTHTVHARRIPTILAVGDSIPSWEALVRMLTIEGYLVLSARNATEALSLAKTHSRPIHFLLLDQTMVGSSLHAELSPYQPGIQALIATASVEATVERVKLRLDTTRSSAAGI